jgi:D-aspartate ligase
MKRAIVLGCRDIGLAVIRALAAKDIAVMAIPCEVYDFAHFSRFVSAKTKRISSLKENVELLGLLMSLNKDWDGAFLLPASDPAAVFIARNREELINRFVPAVQGWEVISRIINKAALYEQAGKIGIPAPIVFYPDSAESLIKKRDELTFPCILKPYETHKFFPVFHRKSFLVRDFGEMLEKYTLVQENNLRVMVSEIIPGADDHLYDYLSYIDRSGSLSADACMQKMRQHPPGFGMARVSKTVPVIQEIKQLALKLLKSFSYRGFSAAEFKFDRRDNKYKLMEINVRPVLQERLFLAAGINFPYIAYMDQVEGTSHISKTCEPEMYWIDIIRDLYGSVKWRRREKLAFRDYLGPYFKKKVFCSPFFDDPVPLAVRILILIREGFKSSIALGSNKNGPRKG